MMSIFDEYKHTVEKLYDMESFIRNLVNKYYSDKYKFEIDAGNLENDLYDMKVDNESGRVRATVYQLDTISSDPYEIIDFPRLVDFIFDIKDIEEWDRKNHLNQ